jgi:hypothetical protein
VGHLEGVFDNPNRAAEAYQEYQHLMMKPKDDFNDFLAEFVRLAEQADQPEVRRKRDLYNKLPNLLQTQMVQSMDKTTTDFDKFVRKCQRYPSVQSQGVSQGYHLDWSYCWNLD